MSRFGNAGNGLIRALNSWQVDLALIKETKLSERFSLQFGIQAFNIFNHVQLGDPGFDNLAFNYNVSQDQAGNTVQTLTPAATLGQIVTTNNFNNNNDNAASPNTGTGLPRQLQFMLRVRF